MNKTIEINFLTSNGKLPEKSGLNWGESMSSPNFAGDSYIPIRKKEVESGIVPSTNQNLIYDITFDDGQIIKMQFEGRQTIDGIEYPKQLTSYGPKSILGHYLRSRLRVPNNHFVTKQDLYNYGRNTIDLSFINGKYYLNFGLR